MECTLREKKIELLQQNRCRYDFIVNLYFHTKIILVRKKIYFSHNFGNCDTTMYTTIFIYHIDSYALNTLSKYIEIITQ